MSDRLFIVGAGGLGREVHDIAMAAGRRVAGFLDDDPSAESLGPIDSADPDAGEFVIAVGEPSVRFHIAERLTARGCRFSSVIHPTAVIGSRVTIGDGVIVAPFANIGADAVIGDHVVLNVYSLAGHDCVIEPYVVLSPYAAASGTCRLERGVFLGTQSAVTPGLTVGASSKLAAGAVVTADVPPGSLAVGNPARGRVIFPVMPQSRRG